jgi:hypothetical protein
MQFTYGHALHIEEQASVSFTELVAAAGMPEADVRELVLSGVFEPLEPAATPWSFRADALMLARRAASLCRDFDLDAHAAGVLLGYLARIDALEQELRALRARAVGL